MAKINRLPPPATLADGRGGDLYGLHQEESLKQPEVTLGEGEKLSRANFGVRTPADLAGLRADLLERLNAKLPRGAELCRHKPTAYDDCAQRTTGHASITIAESIILKGSGVPKIRLIIPGVAHSLGVGCLLLPAKAITYVVGQVLNGSNFSFTLHVSKIVPRQCLTGHGAGDESYYKYADHLIGLVYGTTASAEVATVTAVRMAIALIMVRINTIHPECASGECKWRQKSLKPEAC